MKTYKCRVCLRALKDDKMIALSVDDCFSSYYEQSASKAIDESCKRAWHDMTLNATFFGISIYLEEFVEFHNFHSSMSSGLGLAFVRHEGQDCQKMFEEAKAKILAQIGESNED